MPQKFCPKMKVSKFLGPHFRDKNKPWIRSGRNWSGRTRTSTANNIFHGNRNCRASRDCRKIFGIPLRNCWEEDHWVVRRWYEPDFRPFFFLERLKYFKTQHSVAFAFFGNTSIFRFSIGKSGSEIQTVLKLFPIRILLKSLLQPETWEILI